MATDSLPSSMVSSQSSKSLQGRTALITGASSGLGRAIALAYAEQGAQIVCADINPNPPPNTPILSKTLAATDLQTPTVDLVNQLHPLESNGGQNGSERAVYVHCDTTRAAHNEAAVRKCVDVFGRLDIMVCNAGIAVEAQPDRILRLHEQPEEWFDRTFEVNAKGVWLGCKSAVTQMLAQDPLGGSEGDRGWIINMCSVLGLVGMAGTSCYSGSKGAVLQMVPFIPPFPIPFPSFSRRVKRGLELMTRRWMFQTKSIALEYAKDRIHVNCISPGFAETAMLEPMKRRDGDQEGAKTTAMLAAIHPWGQLGRPEDIARAAVFLAGDGASWVTGHCLAVDGGYTAQ
ncbi:hypothetical protein EPUS_06356 [Endocarpon pusillum Z07020]|uniref:Uncharacterized protein n=1 Tax=Endocarpon pusillum (strain Z07020 / HMAS-L-300199) TaxID=1263415 RepID=U1HJC2_ENDPU|nr:uncharacterized protein EPUS_06356 [Endocarpon pusillum Z07020]ERF70315.1 hypothetical protein EPUS_06356 [Endocarpon pusillum Z07020]